MKCQGNELDRGGESQVLWYAAPASQWEEALPVGNGRLGAMVFGGIVQERYQLNEESLWSGGPQDADNPESLPALGKIRELLFAGKYAEAQELVNKTQVCRNAGKPGEQGVWPLFGCYQTLGDLVLAFGGERDVTGYRRSLDLREAVTRVGYELGGATFSRETFASAADQVLVTRIEASKAGAVSFVARLSRAECVTTVAEGTDGLVMMGQMMRGASQSGMRFVARARVLAEGGSVRVVDGTLHVENANAVTILLAAQTDYEGKPWESLCRSQIDQAALKSYASLRQRHVEEYAPRFARVSLELKTTELSKRPTDERLRAFSGGSDDHALAALYFQYGRYLLLCSSRGCSLPANLQGIWADGTATPWNCDYHTNINVQMNYWPAETTNLGECVGPLVEQIERMLEAGARTAKIHYNARGWVVHTVHNIWGYTSPGEWPIWGLFPMATPWLCQHLWEHYAFTLDKAYLKRVFPIMRGATEFCLDWLVENPRTGQLVSGPASSPENVFVAPDGTRASITMGPAMDQQIIWDHFTNYLEAAETLGIDDETVGRTRLSLARLAGPKIGSDGRLMEWAEEFEEPEPHHRHVSHLFAVHPGRQISPRTTPDLAEAAKKTLVGRGDDGTGWSMAWKICFWARLGDGDHALKLVRKLISSAAAGGGTQHGSGVYANLFCSHPPFQIDGNFGGAAGIAEMLLQSHDGTLSLLPSLPTAWADGEVKGLCARGGFEVGIQWAGGRLQKVAVRSNAGGVCRLRYGASVIEQPTQAGGEYEITASAFGKGTPAREICPKSETCR